MDWQLQVSKYDCGTKIISTIDRKMIHHYCRHFTCGHDHESVTSVREYRIARYTRYPISVDNTGATRANVDVDSGAHSRMWC